MKELEALEKQNNNLKNSLEISLIESQKLRKENYKLEKAINIISEKQIVHINFLQVSKHFVDYNAYINASEWYHEMRLTEEEFKLLKEVFGNE